MIEVAIVNNNVQNNKEQILKWVKNMSKYSQDVINMLYQHHNTYISGQHIANQLNISRAAVKKIIDQLKVEGCDIVSINHKDIS